MEMTKTRLSLTCAVALMANLNNAVADVATAADTILNWGEQTYSQFLPEHESTQTLATWFYRYYPQTDLYVGINSADEGVYLLYGKPGASPVYLESVTNLLAQIAALTPPEVVKPPVNNNPVVSTPVKNELAGCDAGNAPQGVVYNQSGNNVRITTGGRCVAFPKNDICLPKSPVSGGISVLKRLEIQSYNLQGIDFAIPAMAQTFEPQIKSNGSIKSCIKNAPQAFANLTFNLDGCFDVTEKVKDYPSIEGLIKVSPPVTMKLQGNFATQTVPDCFTTDAAIITDAVTKEIWDKKGDSFVKR